MENVVNLLSPLSLTQRPTIEKLVNLLSPLYYQADSILFLFSCIVLNFTFMALDKFFPKYLAYYYDFPSWLHFLVEEELINNDTKIETPHKQDIGIKRGEVGFVMTDIGISLSQEGDEIRDFMSHEEFSTLFDQMEPGLHEVEEAFSIFDQNRDGFIDAKELQTVLINLGLREGTNVDACQSMIDKYDRNRKGKIDQIDFFKLVESALL
ncbi:putative calcium-binding protein CML45 [Carex littledalei]|uniref:Putative calcium-binding protein CML45 n=1 Tax=Carex littledalei TaxID=544730 RepID=A0A833V258_9POAL|nr:putative calcium-binding protein CML45 [Carex littledalei]